MDVFKEVVDLCTDKEAFLNDGKFLKVKKGQSLWKRGDIGEIAAFIISGEFCLVYHDKQKDQDLFLADYEPGNFVGYYVARLSRPRAGNLIATKNAEVFSIHHSKLTQHIERSKKLSHFMYDYMTKALLSYESRIISLRVFDAKSRLANYILSLKADDAISSNVRLPKIQYVASKLHMEKETLSRQLRLIEEEGYIKRAHRDVTILDIDGLKQLCV